jgi:hypothetical protein
MMRRGCFLLLLLTCGATASAQQFRLEPPIPVTFRAPVVSPDVHASPDDMVARLMSFDRNSDGKVTRDELFERMENVIDRGDANGDAALDAAEIRAVAQRPPAPIAARGFQAGRYGFGDESGQSSRLRIEGALEDLRLASPAREQAVAIVKGFAEALEKKASTELLNEMATMLPPEQMAIMRTTVTRQLPVSQLAAANGTKVFFMAPVDFRRLVESFRLPEPQNSRAMAAVEWFKNRMQPGDAERTALLAQLDDVLTPEEHDNLRAALERRPIVKSSGMIMIDGLAASGVIINNAPASLVQGAGVP